MSIERQDVEKVFQQSGLERVRFTKKVVEFRSCRNGQVLYFRTDIGLPNYIRLVVHPTHKHDHLAALEGVRINAPKEFQHGSNMTSFPMRRNGGVDEIHYGRAMNVASLEALSRFASAFHEV
jgi:hypothetical protein